MRKIFNLVLIMSKRSFRVTLIALFLVFSGIGCVVSKSITDLFKDYMTILKDKKFTLTAGLSSQKFTVPDSDFHGYSKNKFFSVNYKWSPSIESNVLFVQGKNYVYNRDATIQSTSASNTLGGGLKYIISEYLNVVASYAQSKSITYKTVNGGVNTFSEKSWATIRTPSVSLNYLYPVASSIYSLLTVGASHSFVRNHAYVNTQGSYVGKKNAEKTKCNLGATVMYTGNPLVVPFIKTTYENTLNSTNSIKSRHAYSLGGGAALLGGLLAVSFSAGSYNKSIKNKVVNLAGTIKF